MEGLNRDDSRPPYLQLAGALRGLITNGELRPGMKLPKHDELVSRYGVSLGTVKRALGVLQDEGLIVSRRGEGAFVRNQPVERSGPTQVDVSALQRTIEDLAQRLTILEQKVDKL